MMNDVSSAEAKYKQSKKQLDAMQDRYKKSFLTAVQSDQNYERADKDANLSRANVDKFKAEMLRKKQECEDAKKDYAAQLERTNEDQRGHFAEVRFFRPVPSSDAHSLCRLNFVSLSGT